MPTGTAPVPIAERYFEDYPVGEITEFGDYPVTEAEVIAFAPHARRSTAG